MYSVRFKEGVTILGTQPETLWAIDRAGELWKLFEQTLTVTSPRGDRHSYKSKHYSGMAFDARTRDLPAGLASQLVNELAKILGPDFDVILESDHIHVEYDPKGVKPYPTNFPYSASVG